MAIAISAVAFLVPMQQPHESDTLGTVTPSTETPTALAAPEAPKPAAPVLPWWAAVALLGGLAWFSAMLVGLTLLVFSLMPRPDIEQAAVA